MTFEKLLKRYVRSIPNQRTIQELVAENSRAVVHSAKVSYPENGERVVFENKSGAESIYNVLAHVHDKKLFDVDPYFYGVKLSVRISGTCFYENCKNVENKFIGFDALCLNK